MARMLPFTQIRAAIGAKTALIPKVHTITMRFKAFTAQAPRPSKARARIREIVPPIGRSDC